MVKKIFSCLAALFIAFFFTFSFSHAESVTSGKMYDAFHKKFSDENYDFKVGTFQLNDFQTFNLSEPIQVTKDGKVYTISKVQAAMASFKTVRDSIFLKDWNEYTYYAPDEGLILTEGDVMNVPQIKDFQNSHKASVSLELGPIIFLLLLLFIIPLVFGFIWLKTQYNTLEFKLQNRLFEQDAR